MGLESPTPPIKCVNLITTIRFKGGGWVNLCSNATTWTSVNDKKGPGPRHFRSNTQSDGRLAYLTGAKLFSRPQFSPQRVLISYLNVNDLCSFNACANGVLIWFSRYCILQNNVIWLHGSFIKWLNAIHQWWVASGLFCLAKHLELKQTGHMQTVLLDQACDNDYKGYSACVRCYWSLDKWRKVLC